MDLLKTANSKALEKGASYVNSQIFLVNEQKYLATYEGSYVDQDIYRIFPNIGVSMVDRASGSFKNRSGFGTPMDGV